MFHIETFFSKEIFALSISDYLFQICTFLSFENEINPSRIPIIQLRRKTCFKMQKNSFWKRKGEAR